MNPKLEAQIQKEIRRRAFQSAEILQQQRQHLQTTQYTLDALEEVTGLQRSVLESIADDTRHCLQEAHDDFFSIKNQILMTCGGLGLILILGGFAIII